MTRHFFLTILTSLLLFSCQTSEVKTNEQTPTNSDSIQKAVFEKFHQDSADCAGLLDKSVANIGLFTAFCPSDTMEGVPVSSKKTIPFDTLITKTKDTLFYSFKVSNECCVKYSGLIFQDDDTLILTYSYCGDACDCYCDYLLTFKVPLKKYKFKKIDLNFLDVKNIRDKSGHRS